MGEKQFISSVICMANILDSLSMDQIMDDPNQFLVEDSPFVSENVITEELKETQPPSADDLDPDVIFGTSQEVVGNEEGNKNKENQDGEDENTKADEAKDIKSSTSPKLNSEFYSNLADTFHKEGILSTLDEEKIKKIQSVEDFALAFENEAEALVEKKLDERTRRVYEALNNGIDPDEIQQYERAIDFFENINTEKLTEETPEGEAFRKQIIAQDLKNKGFKPERIEKIITQFINSGDDLEEAKNAVESCKEHYKAEYNYILEEQKINMEEVKKQRQKLAKDFENKTLKTEEPIKGLTVDENTRKKILENVIKPIYKDENGRPYSTVHKYMKENASDAEYYFSLFYTLTKGFTDLGSLVNTKLKQEKRKYLRELDAKISNIPMTDDGLADFNFREPGNESVDFILAPDTPVRS